MERKPAPGGIGGCDLVDVVAGMIFAGEGRGKEGGIVGPRGEKRRQW